MKKIRLALALIAAFYASSSFAANGVTYHGRLLDSDGQPVTSPVVRFKLQVRSPGAENCLMYQEVHTRDMTTSNGVFAITLNDGTASPANSEPFSLDRVFQNRGVFTFASGKCALGTTYTPQLTDGRVLSVEFSDEQAFGVGVWEALPAQAINSVPMAIESMTVGGYGSGSMLRVNDAGGAPKAVSALTEGQYGELMNLLLGTSPTYRTSAAAVPGADVSGNIVGNAAGFTGALAGDVTGAQGSTSVVRLQGRSVDTAAPTEGQVLTWSSSNNRWEPSTPSSGSMTSITATLPLRSSGGASPNLTIDDASTTAKGVVQLASGSDSAAGLAVQANDSRLTNARAPNGAAGGDLGGNYPNPDVVRIRGAAVSATAPTAAGQVLRYDGTSQYVPSALGISDIANLSTQLGNKLDQSLMPPSCGSNQTLNFSSPTGVWTCVGINNLAADKITSGAFDIARIPTGTSGTTVAVGNDARFPSATCASGNKMRWDGSAWVCEAESSAGATSANTANTIVKRDAAGNFAAGTITANLAGNVTGNVTGNVSGTASNITGTLALTNGGTGATTQAGAANAVLPPQSGNSGKFLTTDGSDVSWGSITESDPKVGANATNQLSKWSGTQLVASGVYENGGNVGIGTSAPTSRLQIIESSAHNPFQIKNTGNFNSVVILDSNRSSANTALGGFSAAWNGTTVASVIGRSGADTTQKDDGELIFRTAENNSLQDRMIITQNGNVGIGTTNPQMALDVAGAIRMAGAAVSCAAAVEGSQRYNSTSKKMEFCDGSNWVQMATGSGGAGVDVQSFSSSGTWTKPASGTLASIECWGGGGSGAKWSGNVAGGGGGGGGYMQKIVPLSALTATVAVTIGVGGAAVTAGNAHGNAGGNSTFGAYLTAYGGGGGQGNGGGGGGGGGAFGAGAGAVAGAGHTATSTGGFWGGGTGGVWNDASMISAVWGGGGGGGCGINWTGAWTYAWSPGGTSLNGGSGGAGGSSSATSGTAGSQPGGGGGCTSTGASSGAGGNGQCRIIVW